MLKHTRAAMTHFDSKDQVQLLQSSERCLEHTRAMISRFGSKEQASMPRFTMALQSLGKYLKHTKW